jgi:hypothetical protein
MGLARMPDPETSLIRNAEFWARKRGLGQSRERAAADQQSQHA